MIEQQMIDVATLEQIEQRVRTEIEAGVEFGLNAPYPERNEVDQDVYAY